jgi:hypothetical protein
MSNVQTFAFYSISADHDDPELPVGFRCASDPD